MRRTRNPSDCADFKATMEKVSDQLVNGRAKACAYFRKKWPQHDDHAEDFGSYCVEQWLKGRSTSTALKFLSVEYLRSNIHSLGEKGSMDAMTKFNRDRADIQDPLDLVADFKNDIERFDKHSLLRHSMLNHEKRAIVILYCEWGMTPREIGDVMTMSDSMVLYHLTDVVTFLRECLRSVEQTAFLEQTTCDRCGFIGADRSHDRDACIKRLRAENVFLSFEVEKLKSQLTEACAAADHWKREHGKAMDALEQVAAVPGWLGPAGIWEKMREIALAALDAAEGK